MKQLKLAIIGFGNVGRAFAKLLEEKRNKIESETGVRVMVTAIATATKGNLSLSEGIDITRAICDIEKNGKFTTEKGLIFCSTEDLLKNADYDVMIELSPLNIKSGQPAISYIEEALISGKHVITANKGPIAWDYKRLSRLAREKNLEFYFETAVMDGTPVFNMYDYALRMTEVTKIKGILNTTTNFILEKMAEGQSRKDIIKEGQKRGFVEADPSMDIEGYDAAAKITALINVLMDENFTPDMVKRKGIEDIEYDDIKAAEKEGKVIKLICRTEKDETGKITASVGPEAVEKDDIFATVKGTTSLVSITTDLMKTVTVIEHDPEIEQTAYGVFSDMLRLVYEHFKNKSL